MSSDLPLATVIVPTRRRPGPLRRCVTALRGQDYPASRLEIVVVLDGAEDRPRDLGDVVTIVSQAAAGPGPARNRGAAVAGGELLAFTDDDCEPASDWLRRLAQRCRSVPRAGAGGRTVNASVGNRWSETAALIVNLSQAAANRDPQHARFFGAANLALPAEGFRWIGGFDAGFRTAEDRDLCDRWVRAGLPLLEVAGATVLHHKSHTARSFWRTHTAYGDGAYRLHRSRAQRDGERGLSRGWIDRDFYRGVVHAAVAGGPRLTGRLAFWQAANLIGFASGWADDQRRGQSSRRRTLSRTSW